MEYFEDIVAMTCLLGVTLLISLWMRLDIGFRKPNIGRSLTWIMCYIVWVIVETVVVNVLGIELDEEELLYFNSLPITQAIFLFVIMAPLLEEIAFRGALFSWTMHKWGTKAAILFPSMLWSLLHMQYDFWLVMSIFVSGVVLGLCRLTSGSLIVPLALHICSNLAAVASASRIAA